MSGVLISSFANVASGLIVKYLPLGDPNLSLQVSMFAKDAIIALTNKTGTQNLMTYFFTPKPHAIIAQKIGAKMDINNPIFEKIEDYVIQKYMSQLTSCQLITKQGDIEVSLENFSGKFKDIEDEYLGIKYIIKYSLANQEIVTSTSKSVAKTNNFIIETSNGTFKDIKTYIMYIFQLEPKQAKMMTIYQPRQIMSSNNTYVWWDKVRVKSNKTIHNTVLHEHLEKELLQDIDTFVKNEDWYNSRAISYRRGYMLYGPPGTGKTSIIKSIANTYNMKVFTIDFETINKNDSLLKLITDMTWYARDSKQPHILCFEDIDRSNIFNEETSEKKETKVSPDCLLNVLDGVVEVHGRIVFMTVNNLDKIKTTKIRGDKLSDALLRPGRIDKVLKVDYVSPAQIKKMINIFYQKPYHKQLVSFPTNITSAEVISGMQLEPMNADKMIQHLQEISTQKIVDKEKEKEKEKDIEKTTSNTKTSPNTSTNKSKSKRKTTTDLENEIKKQKKEISDISRQFRYLDSKKKKLSKLEAQLKKKKTLTNKK